jgi:hypothetical protein
MCFHIVCRLTIEMMLMSLDDWDMWSHLNRPTIEMRLMSGNNWDMWSHLNRPWTDD